MKIKGIGYEIKVTNTTGPLAFKGIDVKEGIVEGYFSAFGNKDSDGDIILPGAFARSIKSRGPKSSAPKIKHFLDHDKENVIAVIKELEEDSTGLRYVSKAGRHTEGRDFLLMAEDGIITEHSIGFETIQEEKKDDANYMSELLLWEGSSLQAWGSNGNTPIVGVKALEFDLLQTRFALLEKSIRNGKYSDQQFPKLIKELETITQLLTLLTEETTDSEHSDNESATTLSDLKYDEVIDVFKAFKNTLKN